jgi:hypothetical protein
MNGSKGNSYCNVNVVFLFIFSYNTVASTVWIIQRKSPFMILRKK